MDPKLSFNTQTNEICKSSFFFIQHKEDQKVSNKGEQCGSNPCIHHMQAGLLQNNYAYIMVFLSTR